MSKQETIGLPIWFISCLSTYFLIGYLIDPINGIFECLLLFIPVFLLYSYTISLLAWGLFSAIDFLYNLIIKHNK